jgi:sulfate/thiosulfate-binding protein
LRAWRQRFSHPAIHLGVAHADTTLLNASYEPTGRFYSDLNKAFVGRWQAEQGEKITIYQSHAGSGAQARSVSFGLEADVVTLALAYDIDAIAERAKLLPKDWQKTVAKQQRTLHLDYCVHGAQGNPKQIRDWPDLAREGVSVVTPNPKGIVRKTACWIGGVWRRLRA